MNLLCQSTCKIVTNGQSWALFFSSQIIWFVGAMLTAYTFDIISMHSSYLKITKRYFVIITVVLQMANRIRHVHFAFYVVAVVCNFSTRTNERSNNEELLKSLSYGPTFGIEINKSVVDFTLIL